jgi:hypothetical protein
VAEVTILHTRFPCIVTNIMDSSYGKYPVDSYEKMMIMEYGQFLRLLSDYLPTSLITNNYFVEFLNDPNLVSLDYYAD